MEPKPKERIVFDEDLYYGDEGEEMAISDLMERDGLTEDEVREDFTDDEIFNHQMDMKDFDYEEEMRALAAFFNGEKSDMSDFVNPYGGNHILVSGSVGRWNGTSTGIAVYKDFDAATDCSPSRFGQGNVFADCEIQKVWDENGTLYLAGAHHDGRVSVEMRQLTDEGERLWGQLDYEDYLPLDGLTAMGKHYELGDENRFVHDLYNSPELCATPPVTWSSPSDALLRNTRKRKGRSLTTSPPENGACISSIPVNPVRTASLAEARREIPPAPTRWSSSTIPRITGSS